MEILRVVLPGDQILQFNPGEKNDCVYIGPGLRWQENVIFATRSGLLKKTSKNLYYVDSHQKRYVPQRQEFVIGIILKRKGENYLIDIGGSERATISCLAYENTSKKNRKEMKPGDLVFGQLLVANKDMEPELVCIDLNDASVGMGSLPENGIVFTIPLHVARMIVNPHNSFLKIIAKKVQFNIVVGYNGRVWLMAQRQCDMVAVMNCLMMLEVMSLEDAKKQVFKLLDSFSLKLQEYNSEVHWADYI